MTMHYTALHCSVSGYIALCHNQVRSGLPEKLRLLSAQSSLTLSMDDSTRWSISWMLELVLLWFLYCTMPCLRDTYTRPNLAYHHVQPHREHTCTHKKALAVYIALQCRCRCMNVSMYGMPAYRCILASELLLCPREEPGPAWGGVLKTSGRMGERCPISAMPGSTSLLSWDCGLSCRA